MDANQINNTNNIPRIIGDRINDEKVSKSGSMKGFKLKELLRRNKNNIKGVISIGTGFIALKYGDTAMIQALFASGSGFITKFILDSFDFWLSEVKL